jgi:hypothetical protein
LTTREAGTTVQMLMRGRKSVRIRHGRAIVIELSVFDTQFVSQTRRSMTNARHGTRNPKEMSMADATFVPTAPPAIPISELLPWAVFGGLIMLLAIYFVGAEQGATSIFSGMYVHEFVHDGRHLLGFPCH